MKIMMKILLLLVAITSIMPHFVETAAAEQTSNKSLKKFLYSTEGTYGWQPVKGDISYDFFPDGRLQIQGADGEATMWEGTWKLNGNQLTLVNKDLRTKMTVTATQDGDALLLDDTLYNRYKPQ